MSIEPFIRLQNCNSCSIGNGSWITDGVVTKNFITRKTERGKVTTVQCSANHLTSFAVLVDVAGGLEVLAAMYIFKSMQITDAY